MPGNEVGDRVHNFFGQENLPQGQHHSQPIDGNWPGLSSNPWVGGPRQIGGPFISGLKNYNVPQQEPERGHGSQPAHMPHGLNYMQPNLMPEFGRVQSPSPQPALNGYVHGNQAFQGRQNEASFLGMDSDTNRHNMPGRSLSMSQLGNNVPEHNKKIPMRLDASESPVSFDFFGGQQPMSGQHQLNVMQPLPRQQQSANNDMQLLQRHMMLQQIQELQRHQQLQQLETRQQGFANQKQAGVSHPPSMINGVPVNEASNNMWQPDLVPGGTSWLQRGASPVMQGSSSGHMFAADQGQALRLMDMVPQQADQSLYGVPISSTSGTPSFYSHAQIDKAAMHQISVNNDFVSGNNQYATFLDQVNMQDQEKNNFGTAIGQGLENLQQVSHQQRIPPTQELAESSEPSQEKSFNDVGSSQNAATLDPTEEKILFGSDDNIWEAFGGGTAKGGMGNYNNMLDGAEFSSGFSALQSGSWSALMQSAVAESSSGDAGAQEEWCGPTVQNSDALMGNQQLSSANHGGKLQGVWGGDNNFQPASKANSTVNSFGLPQLQQPEYKSQQVQGDTSHIDSSQRSVPKFSEQGSKWSDRGHPQRQPVEASQMYGGISHQNTPSHNSDAHPYSRKNGWNFIDSVSTDGGENFRTPENKNNFQPAQSSEGKRGMHDELGHVAATWRVDSSPKSNAELELPTKSSIGSPRVGRNASSLNNIAVANSSNMRPNQEGSQLPNSQKLDFWKVIDSSVGSKGGAESMGKNQHSFGKSSQILESSGNHHSSDREMVDLHEVDNAINKDTSTDGFNSLHHTFGNSSKDNNVWSDAGDSCTIPGNKQKYSGNTGRKPPGTRKFQYHPMGDVDVDSEPSYGTKQLTHSQNLRSKGYDQGSIDPSKFAVQMDKNSSESEKGHGPVGQADTKGFDPTASKSMFPGFVPNTASFGRGISNFAPSKVPQSSQHMLELLDKVDHPREHGTPMHLSSSERNLSSEMPEAETSDGSVSHVQRNQPSNSQNFGLQLAPPSQRLSNTEHAVSSQNSKPGFGSPHVIPESAEKGPMHPTSRSSAMPYSLAHEPSQGHGNKKASYPNAQGSYSTAFPSGFPYTRNLESQHMHAASGQIMANQAAHMPYNRISTGPKQLDDSSERAHASQFVPSPVSDFPANAPQSNLAASLEISQKKDLVQQIMESDRGRLAPPSVHQNAFTKMSPNSWTSVSREQPSLSSQPSIAALGLFKSQLQSKLNEQDTVDGRSELSGIEIISADSQSFIANEQPDKEKMLTGSQGNESAVNNFSESSNPSHTATQRDIEAFGRSLRPNNSLRDNYSLLHQVQAMKSTEIESTDRSGKRLKGSEHAMDPLQAGPPLPYGYSSGSRDSLANQSGDQQMLNFSAKIGETCESNSSSQNVSNNFLMNRGNVPLRGELPQISPRMAPSWFDQYGSFKNGQTLQAYDVLRSSAIKPIEQPLVVANPSDDQLAHPSEKSRVLGEIQQLSAAKSVVTEQVSSPHSTPHASNEALVVERPKKRKTATSELVPWNKELIDVSQRLQTISMAEAHWAGATNRLAEKVEGEMAEDAPPVLRPRRRLILTTQLMQQLLCPPPASVLFSDPNSQTESAAYFSARYALADACNAAGCSESEAPLPGEDKNLSSEKLKTPKIIDMCLSKVEDFIGRARKLENELLRLDKRASILDLRVECQDLEKFSVINRFAKFHGRGQADGGDASSSASDGTLTSQKPCPQKYVTGLPSPRNLPDRVQCLSL